jgi:hypothetical protein
VVAIGDKDFLPGEPVVLSPARTQGRELSPLAPLRALPARTPHTAWSGPVVGEGVMSCPRAGCGKSARPRRSYPGFLIPDWYPCGSDGLGRRASVFVLVRDRDD